MKKDKLYVLGTLLTVVWIGMTYFLFVHRPLTLSGRSRGGADSSGDGASAADSLHAQERRLARDMSVFERKLRGQIRENGRLLDELQVLREEQAEEKAAQRRKLTQAAAAKASAPARLPDADPVAGAVPAAGPAPPFVDGANEYDEGSKADAAVADPSVVGGDSAVGVGVGPDAGESDVSAPSSPDRLSDVMPVLMFACNRVSVSKALDLLLEYRSDAEKFPIIVSQDCGHAATRNVLKGYGDQIIYVEQPDQSAIGVPKKEKKFAGYFKIARHYGWALNHTFNDLGYDQVIIVEDDLEVAPDFYEYFQATLPVLRSDPSLFCVSAWNDNGKEGLIDETRPELLYRSDFFGGLGWMLTRKLWQSELAQKWPRSYWDDWIREPRQRQERACIRPEVSRTKTFGKVGVSNGLFFDKHLKFIKLNARRVNFTGLDLGYLRKDKYDARMDAELNETPVVSLEEVKAGVAKARHGDAAAVRLIYHNKIAFKRIAKALGIMDDFKSGVPRMAYKGVVSTIFNGQRVFVAPNLNWGGYDPKW